MLPLIALVVSPSWVLFSPIARQLNLGMKVYEDGYANAWAGPHSFNLDRAVLRWPLPPNAFSDDGLASGISFAIHKDFCERLLPLFPEGNEAVGGAFLNCRELRDAIKRGFDTWAINHKKIYFRDVSEQCKDVTSHASCPAAELWIVPDNDFASANDLAAYVTHDLGDIDFAPYSTAGVQVSPGLGVRGSRMAVRAPTAADTSDDFCWYLDSTFCYTFHRWKDDAVDVVMIARIVCVVLFVLALAAVLWVVFQGAWAIFQNPMAAGQRGALRKKESVFAPSFKATNTVSNLLGAVNAHHRKHMKGEGSDLVCGNERITNLVHYISVAPTGLLAFAIFWMIFSPVFYFRIFIPCTACYDFEATIAHEVGHVLGFHHPDREWELNLNANTTMQPGVCTHPFDYVHLNQTQHIFSSIMYSMTTHRDRTCLSNDDLEGLNFVYPVCDGAYTPIEDTDNAAAAAEPLCIKSARLSGWLRLLYSVLFPTFIVNFLIFILQWVVRRYQKKQMVSLEATADRLRMQRAQLFLLMKDKKDKAEAKITERLDRARSVMGSRGSVLSRNTSRATTTNRRTRFAAGAGGGGGGGSEMTVSTPRQQTEDGEDESGAPPSVVAQEQQAQQRAERLREMEDIELQQAIEASKLEQQHDLQPPSMPSLIHSRSDLPQDFLPAIEETSFPDHPDGPGYRKASRYRAPSADV